ncbi:hypothetical protein [Cyclobacterium qasimii]|uniref:Neutral/alkaline non-lysosomal ceramidase N-terminal domain-containing protein n=2 Tax=Cyclobacterium qasimii TaxID=1350429 RepID=S7WMX0_9BACT|nr:hypothetical protein [Cyclobacterium qasimii]EPR65543.1 hypothetical protein ADICYQ_5464 [Cyclobacterium qasimii M12-11B]GEO19602.1 hypothetical protein CQA01_01360 [Cyclobacterium qasimii]
MIFLKHQFFTLLFLSVISFQGYTQSENEDNLKVGWSTADITPDMPVLVAGQFHARLSEGVMDPVTATILALESGEGTNSEKTIWISCDLVGISDGMRATANLRDEIRNRVIKAIPSILPEQIIVNATHTHAAPYVASTASVEDIYGVSLEQMADGKPAMSPSDYIPFAADKIAEGVISAWGKRKPGGMSLGLGHAVVGLNRLQALKHGKSRMYGNTNSPEFSHIEGYEDHSLNLMYFWDINKQLTGIIINIASPSQVSEHSYELSADFWHDTKVALRKSLGDSVYVLAQASSAGDQSPHVMVGSKAEERMQKLLGFAEEGTGRGSNAHRKYIAKQIVDEVTDLFPVMKANIDWQPEFKHEMKLVPLSRRLLSEEDVAEATKEAKTWQAEYDKLKAEVRDNPAMIETPRWYKDITISYSKLRRGLVVSERYELEKVQPKMPIEVHVVRIGDAVFATNPFELYLDYGMQMKAQSPAIQTFIVQLTGSGSYLPTKRSIEGGAYGAVPASTLMGPKGGDELVEETLSIINTMW